VAKIRALARRLNPRPDGEIWRVPERLEINDLILDEGARTCRRDGDIIELTTAEFDLLSLFLILAILALQGTNCSQKRTLQAGFRLRDWSPFDRSIDVHVSNLRRKLGLLDGMERIRGIRNIGYI
jgi:two-component system response regulator CpxR